MCTHSPSMVMVCKATTITKGIIQSRRISERSRTSMSSRGMSMLTQLDKSQTWECPYWLIPCRFKGRREWCAWIGQRLIKWSSGSGVAFMSYACRLRGQWWCSSTRLTIRSGLSDHKLVRVMIMLTSQKAMRVALAQIRSRKTYSKETGLIWLANCGTSAFRAIASWF